MDFTTHQHKKANLCQNFMRVLHMFYGESTAKFCLLDIAFTVNSWNFKL